MDSYNLEHYIHKQGCIADCFCSTLKLRYGTFLYIHMKLSRYKNAGQTVGLSILLVDFPQILAIHQFHLVSQQFANFYLPVTRSLLGGCIGKNANEKHLWLEGVFQTLSYFLSQINRFCVG